MAGDKELVIKVVVDSTGAVKNLQELDQSVQGIARSSESSNIGVAKLDTNLAAIGIAAAAAGAALGTAVLSVKALINAAERGSALNDVAESFNKISTQAGTTANVFLDKLNKATGETITNFELQKTAIEAVRAGAKPDEFIALTQAARALAEETGGNTKTELEELTQAFETGNVRLLKTKGVYVDVEKAQNDFAKSIGTTRDLLNADGKLQATRIALLSSLKQKTEEGTRVTNDSGDAIARIGKIVADTRDKFVQSIGTNVEFNNLLTKIGDSLKKIDFEPFINFVSFILKNGVRLVEIIGAIPQALQSFADIFGSLYPKIENSTKAMDAFLIKQIQLNKQIKISNSSDKAFTTTLDLVTKKLKDNKNAYIDTTAASEKAADAQEKLKKQFQDNFQATQKAWEEIRKLNSPAGLVGLANNLYDNYSAAVASGKSNKELQQIIDEQVQSWIKDGVALDNVATAMQNFGKEVQGVKEKATGLGAIFQGLFGLDTSTANLAADWTQLLVGALGQAFDNLSVAFGSGGTQFSRLQAGLAGIGAIIGTAIGAYFGAGSPQAAAAGGAIGAEIGNLAAQIGEGVHNLFDNETAGTKAKKEADKFFAGLFDANRLKIVIDGQLQDLQDLVFSGDTLFGGTVGFGDAASGFFDFFDSLSSAAHQSFASLGLAFAALLGDVENLGGTLGAVFANNLGDLNNLQVAIQATGVSAQQLEQAITEAFLNGEISALEAQTAFIEIQNIMSQGIPDAVGAVTTAFDNLKAAGAKGGRYAVDALKDIGAEAKELNLKTLPELFQYLVNSGKYSAEEIKKLQDALAQYGITSLDQLSNLSNETAIAILAALQAANFPFAETSDQIKEIEDGLNKIPKDTHRNIIFDVKLNASAQDRDILSRSKIQIPVTPNGIIAG